MLDLKIEEAQKNDREHKYLHDTIKTLERRLKKLEQDIEQRHIQGQR